MNSSRLNDKLANIRDTLRVMGDFLSDTSVDKFYQESIDFSEADSESPKNTESSSHMKAVLDSARDKAQMLEIRLAHKNELLNEAAALQEDLHKTIEDLQAKVRSLKAEVKQEKETSAELRTQLEQTQCALAAKDKEVSQTLLESSIKIDRETEFFEEIEKLKEKLAHLVRQEHLHKQENLKLGTLVKQQQEEIEELKSGSRSAYAELRTSMDTRLALQNSPTASEESAQEVLNKLKKLLHARDMSGVFLKVSHYYIEHAKDKSNRKLLDKISGLVKELTNEPKNRPTNTQIWHTLVKLKQEHSSLLEAAKVVARLEKLFKVPASQLPSAASKLLKNK